MRQDYLRVHSSIRAYDECGGIRISVGVLNGDRLALKVYGKQEKLRIFLGSTKSRRVCLYGKDEKPYILMGILDEQKIAALEIRNKQGDEI